MARSIDMAQPPFDWGGRTPDDKEGKAAQRVCYFLRQAFHVDNQPNCSALKVASRFAEIACTADDAPQDLRSRVIAERALQYYYSFN